MESCDAGCRTPAQTPGELVTNALLEAFDGHDPTITEAATASLILRNEAYTADRLWAAITTLDEDVADHVWSVIESLFEQPVQARA